MTKRRGKGISFDAMVKFFMQNYKIPTKRDVEKLMEKIDRLELLIRSIDSKNAPASQQKSSISKKSSLSASDQVLSVIARFKNGIGFAAIQKKTGFEDKKLRNIIFRLNKLEQIKRKSRGIYIAK
jgi:hypothetical protein